MASSIDGEDSDSDNELVIYPLNAPVLVNEASSRFGTVRRIVELLGGRTKFAFETPL